MRTRKISIVAALALVAAATALTSVPAEAAVSWTNCTSVHKTYPHGVGKRHAHHHTSGTPVTNFKHSNKLYATAMRHNGGLDRDKDGIACEA